MNAKRVLFIVFGVICVICGAVGTFVPGLPTTPFLLLASWLFYRSSPRLRAWLLNSWLGRYIRDYERNRGITWRKKIGIVVLMSAMCALSIGCFITSPIVRIVVAVAGVVGALVVLFCVPTIKSKEQ